ncbi:MAG: hypothetical protein ACI9SI_000899 [Polaribacter sp.]
MVFIGTLSAMKKLLTLFFLCFLCNGFSQERTLKEISHTQFFEMIAAEKDSVFKLENAFIKFDEKTDGKFAFEMDGITPVFETKDSIVIDKYIDFRNVHFEHLNSERGQGLPHITFTKDINIIDVTSLIFYNCTFEGELYIDTSVLGNDEILFFEKTYPNYGADIGFFNCSFENNVYLDVGSIEHSSDISFNIFTNTFNSKTARNESQIATNSIKETQIDENIFEGNGYVIIEVDNSLFTSIYSNNFGGYRVAFSKESFNDNQTYIVEKNIFNKSLLIHINKFSINNVYRWKQWEGKVLSFSGIDNYLKHLMENGAELDYDELSKDDTTYNNYISNGRYEVENAYKFEMQLLGQFYDFYKLQHDSNYANSVYVEFKNLETQRYAYLHKENPSFDTYFTWKINQFLKIFSGYGTNPSLSILFSLYVILFFAIIYMLFPNNWETGRKNKLMNRLKFFTKYFRQKEGIREIYEEDKHESVMSYNEFKRYMHNSKKEIPSFFLWLTKPIYYFSSYNYKMTGRILNHTDILKGRWVDLPKRRKVITSLIVSIWIAALLIMDLLIKFLNALTLSINTFTTLGFGEIPIKGIPRYLAIIQGFIGWFMLTIFSVSLISQLLN